eukprot:gb/GFBE01029030.1/.p1 GENE.gb/GFBE01029030.1/~~gb/GFBE01029030.1/.p1  ORF type:complete len:339 (+),score=33.27 gb/GFBE01029030.1/:1-1017(+)
MPSDDDGLAPPADGPDWEHGFIDVFSRFQEDVKSWRRREEGACQDRAAGRNLNQRTVASCDFAAEDCLKAHFPDRADNTGEGDAPLQTLLSVARGQRDELQEVLEQVRQHAAQFEGHSDLTAQLPQQGKSARRCSGADVVALLAELLDVASRGLNKTRKEAAARKQQREEEPDRRDGREPRNGRDGRDYRDGREAPRGGRDDGRPRERDVARGKDDYRRDDRRRDIDEREDDHRRGRPREGENGERRGDDRRPAGARREELPRGGSGRSRSRGEVRRSGKGGGRGGDGDRDRERERREPAADRDRGGRPSDRDIEGGSRRPPPRRPDSRGRGLRLSEN